MSRALWLYIDFPALALEAVQDAGVSADQPQVIVNTEQQPQQLYCVNSAAAEWGLEPGLTLSTALALCPELQALPRQESLESCLLERLALLAYQFTPTVLIMPPTGLALELGSCERLLGSYEGLLVAIYQRLTQYIRTPHSGFAGSASAAQLLCRAQWQWQIPDENQQRKRLHQALLAQCPFPDKARQQLRQMGLQNLGELLKLPEHTLIRRFGRDFVKQLQQLSGEQPESLPGYVPPEVFCDEQQSTDGIRSKEGLLFLMKPLLQNFSEYLLARQSHCRSLRWRFEPLMGQAVFMSLQIAGSQCHWQALLELSRLQLERLEVPGLIEIVGLHSDDFVDMPVANYDLFSRREFADDSELPDKLRARLGAEAVSQPALSTGTLPEQSFELQGLAGGQQNGDKTPEFFNDKTARPAWLLAEPDPIQARDGGLFWYSTLQLLQGPERLRSGWWQPREQQRDYYLAVDESGGRYWVFHDSRSKRWFLHGVFA